MTLSDYIIKKNSTSFLYIMKRINQKKEKSISNLRLAVKVHYETSRKR